MVNELGRFFGIRERQAESTDARMDLRRNDPDQQRQRQQQDKDNPASLDWTEDSAVVSVAALRLFLQNFINGKEHDSRARRSDISKKSQAEQNDDANLTGRLDLGDETAAAPQTAPVNPLAQAAQAYQTAAQKYAAPARDTKHESHEARQQPLPLDLPAEDVRLIYRLMDDLQILAERQIDYLHIARGDSFLQSLADAVDKALVTQ